MKVRILTVLFILTNFLNSTSAQNEEKYLSPKKMQKDLKDLIDVIDAHPDPYTKISEEKFNDIVSNVQERISTEMNEIEYYKLISRIVASIGDGHSIVSMPKFWLKEKRKKYGVFPYEVFLTNDNKLFIIKNYGDTNLDLGAQVLEINGMTIDDFVNEISDHISYETIQFRNDRITESFELMLYLVFNRIDQLNFTIDRKENPIVKVSALPYKEWKDQEKELKDERARKIGLGQPYDFSILEPGIAKIDIFSFGIYDLQKYNYFLVKTFKTIKKNKIHSLIIDVRGNYGGWPKIASELFHYINDGYFKTMAQSSMKISYPYRASYTDKNPALRSSNYVIPQRRHYVDVQKVLKGKVNTYVDEDIFFNESPVEKGHEFSGDCFLLIDRKSYSASSSFAATFQCYTMGTIIGEPTGGTKIFRANAMNKTLAKTGFNVNMSTTKLYSACFHEENEPVVPNLEVSPSILDRVHEIDSQLNATLMVIKKIQNAKNQSDK